MRKPFYWKSRRCWYVKGEDRKNIRLDPDEKKAAKLWAEIADADRPESPTAPVDSIVEAYLNHALKTVAETTYDGYSFYLVRFCKLYGTDRVRELKPLHVTRWLDANPGWGVSGQRAAIATVKRCLNWAVDEGLIDRNPLATVKRPPARRREGTITDAEHARMMTATDKAGRHRWSAFRAVLIALRHSGTRPGMVAAVQAAHVSADGSAWVFREHKTRRKTGKPLVVYLSPCLQTLTRIAEAAHPKGALFRNSQGVAWTTNAIRCRMRQLRRKLGLPAGIVAYSFRHTWATNALVNGLDVATVAELLGHRDVRMIAEHYGHLDKQKEYLKQAAAGAMRKKA